MRGAGTERSDVVIARLHHDETLVVEPDPETRECVLRVGLGTNRTHCNVDAVSAEPDRSPKRLAVTEAVLGMGLHHVADFDLEVYWVARCGSRLAAQADLEPGAHARVGADRCDHGIPQDADGCIAAAS